MMSRKGRKPRFDFTPTETHSVNNGTVGVNGQMYVVTFPRASGKITVNYRYDFTEHPFRKLIPHFLLGDAPERGAGLINGQCHVLKLLEEFFSERSHTRFNPESFKSFIQWLYASKKPDGGRRFRESTIPAVVNLARSFYLSGLDQKYPGWSQLELDLITEIIHKVLHGAGWRNTQESVDLALSGETFMSLVRAVKLEFERCREVFEAHSSGERASLHNLSIHYVHGLRVIDPNPYVVFALLFGICYGGRSSELNALTLSDVRIDPLDGRHEIHLHAPDKQDGYLPANDVFLHAFELSRRWSAEARRLCGPKGAETHPEALLVCLSTSTYSGRDVPLIPFSTYHLNEPFMRYFYRKWFTHNVVDEQGVERPLLHAEGDPTKPLWCSFRKIRNAFGSCFSQQEAARDVISKVMRHNDPKMTEMHYLQLTRLEHAKRVQSALQPKSRLLARSLKNPTAAGISEETLRKARECEVLKPSASDTHLPKTRRDRTARQDPEDRKPDNDSGRTQLNAKKEKYLTLSRELEAEGDLRGAENARRRAEICLTSIARMK
jgi:hypothetical protein